MTWKNFNTILLNLYDHHKYCRYPDGIDIPKNNFVRIITISPHSRNKMQLWDKTFMGFLNTFYSKALRVWLQEYGHTLTPYGVMELFGIGSVRVQKAENAIRYIFEAIGLLPMNRFIFSYSNFLAAELEERKTCSSVGYSNSSEGTALPLAGPGSPMSSATSFPSVNQTPQTS